MKTALKTVSSILFAAVILIQPVSAASSLLVQERRRDVDEPQLKYECRYPHLQEISDPEAQDRINVQLKEKAEAFQKTAGLAARRLSGTKAVVQGKYGYEIKRNEGGILSMAFNEELFAGSDRGLVKRTGVTVDTVSGKRLKLKDFFKSNSDYQSAISDEITKQIAQRKLQNRQIEKFKQISWDEEFYVTKDSIVVMFRQYEYFPYECGIQEFPIPLGSLEGILKPEYRS